MEYMLNHMSVYDDVDGKRVLYVGVMVRTNDNANCTQEDINFNIQMPYDRENTLAFIEEQSIAIAKDRIHKAAALLVQDDPSVA